MKPNGSPAFSKQKNTSFDPREMEVPVTTKTIVIKRSNQMFFHSSQYDFYRFLYA